MRKEDEKTSTEEELKKLNKSDFINSVELYRSSLARKSLNPSNQYFIKDYELRTNILNGESITIIEEIKQEFLINKVDVITFLDITPLINNIEFIDLALEFSINFTSEINPKIAESFSNTLQYLSLKLKEKQGGNKTIGKANQKKANTFARKIGKKLDELHEQGFESFGSKADYLNKKGIKTPRNKKWTRSAVKNVYERWQNIKLDEFTIKIGEVFSQIDMTKNDSFKIISSNLNSLNIKDINAQEWTEVTLEQTYSRWKELQLEHEKNKLTSSSNNSKPQ